jgi:hypothetical protein
MVTGYKIHLQLSKKIVMYMYMTSKIREEHSSEESEHHLCFPKVKVDMDLMKITANNPTYKLDPIAIVKANEKIKTSGTSLCLLKLNYVLEMCNVRVEIELVGFI